mmetsp:Transcript_25249/g.63556  ORF Transcript_25249/g.63556 Transcript_25249/m.63556 type:complete len:308 (+) Transcript_25249:1030-1953(+)
MCQTGLTMIETARSSPFPICLPPPASARKWRSAPTRKNYCCLPPWVPHLPHLPLRSYCYSPPLPSPPRRSESAPSVRLWSRSCCSSARRFFGAWRRRFGRHCAFGSTSRCTQRCERSRPTLRPSSPAGTSCPSLRRRNRARTSRFARLSTRTECGTRRRTSSYLDVPRPRPAAVAPGARGFRPSSSAVYGFSTGCRTPPACAPCAPKPASALRRRGSSPARCYDPPMSGTSPTPAARRSPRPPRNWGSRSAVRPEFLKFAAASRTPSSSTSARTSPRSASPAPRCSPRAKARKAPTRSLTAPFSFAS